MAQDDDLVTGLDHMKPSALRLFYKRGQTTIALDIRESAPHNAAVVGRVGLEDLIYPCAHNLQAKAPRDGIVLKSTALIDDMARP